MPAPSSDHLHRRHSPRRGGDPPPSYSPASVGHLLELEDDAEAAAPRTTSRQLHNNDDDDDDNCKYRRANLAAAAKASLLFAMLTKAVSSIPTIVGIAFIVVYATEKIMPSPVRESSATRAMVVPAPGGAPRNHGVDATIVSRSLLAQDNRHQDEQDPDPDAPAPSSFDGDRFPHDHPDHPWHWTRHSAHPDERTLAQRTDCDGQSYSSLHEHFHEQGYVIFTSCSLKSNEKSVLRPVAEYTSTIKEGRVRSAENEAVRALSLDEDTIEFIEYLHGGRRAFPFQTLNFPRGTQQPVHSDLVSVPSQTFFLD